MLLRSAAQPLCGAVVLPTDICARSCEDDVGQRQSILLLSSRLHPCISYMYQLANLTHVAREPRF